MCSGSAWKIATMGFVELLLIDMLVAANSGATVLALAAITGNRALIPGLAGCNVRRAGIIGEQALLGNIMRVLPSNGLALLMISIITQSCFFCDGLISLVHYMYCLSN